MTLTTMGDTGWVNATGLPDAEILAGSREIAYQVSQWVTQTRSPGARGTLLERNRYVVPNNWFAQLHTARDAVANDDVVGGVAEVTEGLMFQGMKWESEEPDDADVFNQLAADLDLDGFMRTAYREVYTASQLIVATWWGWKNYTVRGRANPTAPPVVDPVTGVTKRAPKGPKRKRKYQVWCPVGLSILDAARVVPIAGTVWGNERLAWVGTQAEALVWDQVDQGLAMDPTMSELFLGRYHPTAEEEVELSALGVDTRFLFELNPARVWRHRLSTATYQKWPTIRLTGVFALLDLKAQLMESDRVNLVGASNYLLLIKKGTKEDPAYPEEITNLKENFGVVARLPVIFSDHRLAIEIITPKQDYVLTEGKYDTLDRRIMQRCLGALVPSGTRAETTTTINRMVARVLESRRHMLKRTLELHVAKAVVDHPLNVGVFADEPNLAFTPRNVQLDSDSQVVQSVMALRAQKELSRESTLEFFGFDQEVEAQRREYEDVSGLDDVFGTQVPFSSPALGNDGPVPPPQLTGAQGGRPRGGGNPSANAAKPETRNPTPRKG